MVSIASPPIEIEEIVDSEELAVARLQRQRFDRNMQWLQDNINSVYRQHRGRFICIASQELFVADRVEDAIALAESAHPEDDGRFTRYIPKQKVARLYAL